MKLNPFTGPGSTPARRTFWDQARAAVIAAQKIPGKSVSVDVHQGYGSVISIPQRDRGGGGVVTGACCVDTDCSILTEAACIEAGGTWQGASTDCDPNPCIDVCPNEFDDVTVEVSGFTSCGCVEVGPSSVIIDVTNANGTWVLPNYDSNNWILFDAFSVTAHTYPGVSDCSGEPVDSEISISPQFYCNGGFPLMLFRQFFTPFGPQMLFDGGIFEIENGGIIPYTGGDCGDTSVFGIGGEAVASW